MSDYEIIDLFDRSNCSLAQLSRITGRTTSELTELIMKGECASYSHGARSILVEVNHE